MIFYTLLESVEVHTLVIVIGYGECLASVVLLTNGLRMMM